MTALTNRRGASSPSSLPSISHRCLRRKSLRIYELADPARPGAEVSYDVGQVKEIVQMERRLREQGFVAPVPAGFLEFATCFNQYAAGPERFATYSFVNGRVAIQRDGSPIVWEHFMIDDWLVGWNRDAANQEVTTSSTTNSTTIQSSQTLPQIIDFTESIFDPKLKALSQRMWVAIQTTDELTKFWIKRGAIEHQYATRLADLAETMIGESDSSELRRAIDAVRVETAQQAMKRHDLANQIAIDLESRCVELQLKQRKHWHDVYEPAARKLHHDQVKSTRRRSGVVSEWKQEYKKLRYSLDTRRLQAMKANLDFNSPSEFSSPISESSPESPNTASGPALEWENLRSSCFQLEQDRCQFMEDSLTAFLETMSAISATDRGSVSVVTQWKDLFMPKDFIEDFLQRFPHSFTSSASTSRGQPPLSPIRGPRPRTPSVEPKKSNASRASSFYTARESQPLMPVRENALFTSTPDPSRTSSTLDGSYRSLVGFGLPIPARSHTRRQSQQKGLLPLTSETRTSSPSRSNTLSKFTNVFQRSNVGRNDRNDYTT